MADAAKWYVVHTYSGYENAVAAARYELAMTEIARQEGITITEEELEEYMNQQEEDEE